MATAKVLERTYIVPLRREWLKVPKYKRSKKAVNALKQFVVRHMKSEDVRIGKFVNENIWKDGIKNPPGKVKVNCKRHADGMVYVELFGQKMPNLEKKDKDKKPKGKLEEAVDTLKGKKEAPKKEAKKEAPKKEEKPAEKTPAKTEVKDKTDEAVSKMVAQTQKSDDALKKIEPKPKTGQ